MSFQRKLGQNIVIFRKYYEKNINFERKKSKQNAHIYMNILKQLYKLKRYLNTQLKEMQRLTYFLHIRRIIFQVLYIVFANYSRVYESGFCFVFFLQNSVNKLKFSNLKFG